MNLARFSASYEYLYSPKSWLHLQNSKAKLMLIFLQLIYLPIISLNGIFTYLIFLFLLCQSIKMPYSLKNYFCKSLAVSIFFTLISVKTGNPYRSKKNSCRKILQFSLFNIPVRDDIIKGEDAEFYFYLPTSTLRLITIHLIYIFLIRLLLLTTKHNSILEAAITQDKYSEHRLEAKFIFIIMVSSQFIKIIFEQMDVTKIAYIIRNIHDNKINKDSNYFLIFTSFIRLFIINMRMTVSSIACTLYNKEMRYSSLDTYGYFCD